MSSLVAAARADAAVPTFPLHRLAAGGSCHPLAAAAPATASKQLQPQTLLQALQVGCQHFALHIVQPSNRQLSFDGPSALSRLLPAG